MRIDSRHGINLRNNCSLPFVMYDVQKLKAWIDILQLKRVKLVRILFESISRKP
jgi:hypothetical protein